MKRSAIWYYPEFKLRELVEKSRTIGEVLSFFNLTNDGSNYTSLRKRCERDGINLSKFSRNSTKTSTANSIALKEVMIENSLYNRAMLKKRLIQENVFLIFHM